MTNHEILISIIDDLTSLHDAMPQSDHRDALAISLHMLDELSDTIDD